MQRNTGMYHSICVVMFLLLPLLLFAQTLEEFDAVDATKTIEAFLNSRPYKSTYTTLSVHKWDPNYHIGYSKESINYLLSTFPYEVVENWPLKDSERRIIISISPTQEEIIAVLSVGKRYYGQLSKVMKVPTGIQIEPIQPGLYEID